MKRLLLLLLAAMALGADARAIVLIYSGTTRVTEGPDSPIPSRIRCFYLYAPASRQLSIVRYWTVGGQKKLSASAPAVLDAIATDLPDGRTATVLSSALRLDLVDEDFVNAMNFYRGVRSTLKVRTTGLTVNEPRVFTGFALGASLGTGVASFDERRITVTYSTTRSVKANDANQTIAQAHAAIIAELNALGFQ